MKYLIILYLFGVQGMVAFSDFRHWTLRLGKGVKWYNCFEAVRHPRVALIRREELLQAHMNHIFSIYESLNPLKACSETYVSLSCLRRSRNLSVNFPMYYQTDTTTSDLSLSLSPP
jgi:hypothetical protein